MKHPLIRRMVEDLKNSEGGWRSMCKIADEYGKKKTKEGLVEGRKKAAEPVLTCRSAGQWRTR